jgi:hypothetical protein
MMTFNQYLDSLPPEKARAIRLLEQEWLRSRRPLNRDQGRWSEADPIARAFAEQMEGYEETPAGSRRKTRSGLPGFDY